MRNSKKNYQCSKCSKIVKSKEEIHNGMCSNCYYDYLMDKIEHLGEKQPKPENRLKIFIKKMVQRFFH